MEIRYNDEYTWEGWGKKLKLGSGKCHLRIFDVRKGEGKKSVSHLKPIIVIVSDLEAEHAGFNKMTVKSCASHIATCVARDFNIDPSRMLWIEYYPVQSSGKGKKKKQESFEVVEFTWHGENAVHSTWRPLNPLMLEVVRELLSAENQ